MSPRQNPRERPRPTPGRDGADPRRSETAKRDRFASYTPSCLSGREWLLARQQVEGAVFKADPVSSESVKGFASYLCQFLQRSTDWDRTRPPDLRALLTDEAIKAHCEQLAREGKSVSTRAIRGACLRRMMRGLAGRPPEHSREVDVHRPPAKKPVDLWPVAAVMASCLAPGEAGRRAAAAVAL